MKINKTSNTSKRKIITIATIAAILLIGATAYALFHLNSTEKVAERDESGISYSEPTDEEKTAGEQAKQDSVKASKSDTQAGSDPAPAPVKQSDGSKSLVGVSITAAYKSGDNYRIQTLIQTVTSTGTCTLTITDATGAKYTETVDVQALPSSSTCKGFTVPLNRISTGVWEIQVDFENDTLRGSVNKETLVS